MVLLSVTSITIIMIMNSVSILLWELFPHSIHIYGVLCHIQGGVFVFFLLSFQYKGIETNRMVRSPDWSLRLGYLVYKKYSTLLCDHNKVTFRFCLPVESSKMFWIIFLVRLTSIGLRDEMSWALGLRLRLIQRLRLNGWCPAVSSLTICKCVKFIPANRRYKYHI